jgi:hypothetical protein
MAGALRLDLFVIVLYVECTLKGVGSCLLNTKLAGLCDVEGVEKGVGSVMSFFGVVML